MNKRGQREGCVPLWQRKTCKNWGSKRWLWCLEQRVQWSERRLVGKAYHELGSRSQWLFHVNLGADALSHQIPLCVLHPHVKLQGTVLLPNHHKKAPNYTRLVYTSFIKEFSGQIPFKSFALPLWLSSPVLDILSTDPALLGPDPQSFLCILLNLILKLINSLRYQHPKAFLLPKLKPGDPLRTLPPSTTTPSPAKAPSLTFSSTENWKVKSVSFLPPHITSRTLLLLLLVKENLWELPWWSRG